jgi:hypothetical protein
MTPPVEPSRHHTAVHESGHAVASVLLRFRVEDVDLDGPSGGLTRSHPAPEWRERMGMLRPGVPAAFQDGEARQLAERRLILDLAGRAATDVLEPDESAHYALLVEEGNDLDRARELANLVEAYGVLEASAYYGYVLAVARTFMARQADLVFAVASALEERGRLNGAEVEQIVEAAKRRREEGPPPST